MVVETKISIVIGNSVVDGVLYDNMTARAFAEMLPVTLTMCDYDDVEKCGELEETLPICEETKGYDPFQGDIVYYSPCGCLSIFYRDDGFSTDLISIGRVTGNLAPINVAEKLDVTFMLSNSLKLVEYDD